MGGCRSVHNQTVTDEMAEKWGLALQADLMTLNVYVLDGLMVLSMTLRLAHVSE